MEKAVLAAFRRQARGSYRLIAMKSEPASNRLRNPVTDLSMNKTDISMLEFSRKWTVGSIFKALSCVANQIAHLPESGSVGTFMLILFLQRPYVVEMQFRNPSR